VRTTQEKSLGAKTTMLVIASALPRDLLAAKPSLDRDASHRLLAELFPGERFEALPDGELGNTYTDTDEVYIGHFGELAVIAAPDFALDYPSRLDARFLRAAGSRDVYLHTMHSVVDFLAYGVWRAGRLERSLSLSPDSGILEELGERPAFEAAFWAGEHPVDDPDDLADPEYEPYPFPFHPLELGEVVLNEFFGYQLEGFVDAASIDPYSVPLMRFRR
jgi:hypothetical protein